MSMRGVVRRTYPVQNVVHGVVLQPITDQSADPGGADPALLTQHPKRLRYSIFRSAKGSGEVTDTDTRRPVQAQQDF